MITKGIFLFIYPFEDIVYVLNVCFGSEADCMETKKILGIVLCIQAVLWHFNRDFDPTHGIGLSYVLVWARFDSQFKSGLEQF